jgi:Flp pilus assembly pilin Flp
VAKQSSIYRRIADEAAQTMAEYAIALTVVTVAVITALGLLGTNIVNGITEVTTRFLS